MSVFQSLIREYENPIKHPYESRSENIVKQIGRYFIDQLDQYHLEENLMLLRRELEDFTHMWPPRSSILRSIIERQ